MLKVGDRLLYKKVIIFNAIDVFNPGKYYTIQYVDGLDIQINSWWFKKIKDDASWYIWDYFYTPKQLRRLKLERLRCLK